MFRCEKVLFFVGIFALNGIEHFQAKISKKEARFAHRHTLFIIEMYAYERKSKLFTFPGSFGIKKSNFKLSNQQILSQNLIFFESQKGELTF